MWILIWIQIRNTASYSLMKGKTFRQAIPTHFGIEQYLYRIGINYDIRYLYGYGIALFLMFFLVFRIWIR
jgi:hypothetical protein